jgi:hypothetical protein
MVKWEYLSISAKYGGEPEELRVKRVDGKAIPNWESSGKPLYDYIKELGIQGWELVSEVHDTNLGGAKWKYWGFWIDSDMKEIKIDNKVYKGWPGVIDLMNENGEKSWEMVTASPESGVSAGGGPFATMGKLPWLFVFKQLWSRDVHILRFKRLMDS